MRILQKKCETEHWTGSLLLFLQKDREVDQALPFHCRSSRQHKFYWGQIQQRWTLRLHKHVSIELLQDVAVKQVFSAWAEYLPEPAAAREKREGDRRLTALRKQSPENKPCASSAVDQRQSDLGQNQIHNPLVILVAADNLSVFIYLRTCNRSLRSGLEVICVLIIRPYFRFPLLQKKSSFRILYCWFWYRSCLSSRGRWAHSQTRSRHRKLQRPADFF